MKSILGLIIILGLIELGLESQFDLQNSIFNLNEDNVDDFIEYAKSSGSSILLNVYSNSCKYSNKFTPMFEKQQRIYQQRRNTMYYLPELKEKTIHKFWINLMLKDIPLSISLLLRKIIFLLSIS